MACVVFCVVREEEFLNGKVPTLRYGARPMERRILPQMH